MSLALLDVNLRFEEGLGFYDPPPGEHLDAVNTHSMVKVCWKGPDGGGEFFWAVVIARDADKIRAKVDNNPIYAPLREGDEIAFGPQHIFSIYPG